MARKKDPFNITKADAACVLSIVDRGLVDGMGRPEPGQMCVEAAVAYAMGEQHHDHPACVDEDLTSIKVKMNDAAIWDRDDDLRAAGLRRLAIAQLGSKDRFNEERFWKSVNKQAQKVMKAQRGELKKGHKAQMESYKDEIRIAMESGDWGSIQDIAGDADDIANQFDDIANQFDNNYEEMSFEVNDTDYAIEMVQTHGVEATAVTEWMVQALIAQKIPGTKYLHLTVGKKFRGWTLAQIDKHRTMRAGE